MKTILLTLAALAAVSIAPAALAGEAPLDREALRGLAASGEALCGGWRDRDDSCEDVGFMELLPQDQVLHTYRFRISFEPDYEIVMQETATIEDGALCSTYSLANLTVRVLADGQAAPTEQTLAISAMFEESLAEFEGKQVCESYFRDQATGELTTVVTIDGVRNPDLESSYRILTKDERIHLRQMDEAPDPMRQDV
ncbi:hypothetical protein [Caulobacter sp. NIBR1757]|uniref:hypothetical protein n=1 Tax=Caulobacter sp. NIBR1757 TaxID=3016000 RepID=UPI0022F0021C|nr:hypothetical protein [Caulobacter sp. NIBR1757]WGM39131.1 hypothetical protein AMEJIAPC_02045 [Caulobacter sp. NIBR1757]